ncbi:transglycosylase SLT domain-containing protein [Microbacterium sp.]|uniref:aggregation-promoting factor C-terminal-like domain-containing protein n=1 Tax=Microbacterium sp. TaxID=51671 RepID=UPI0028120A6B|nr:transglycosylase SLT domain-containing protein [Microbacterium sp.]
MTSANETRTRTAAQLTRRDTRASSMRSAAPVPARLSRRRGVLNVFAGVAAFGFLAAYLVPTTAALAEGAPASRYDAVQADAQMYVAAANLAPAGSLQYGSYAIELQAQADGSPHPKASLEEWIAYAESQGVEVPEGTTREEIPTLIAEAEAAEEEEAAQAAEPASDGGAAALASPFYTGGGAPEEWMRAAGIAESDWGYVDYIVSHESGWNPNATNASSGACGLVQALPCSKVPGGGYNPVANLQWATGYATARYGSWAGAYAFWTANHWW